MSGKIEQKSPAYFSITGIRYRGDNYLKLIGFPDTSSFRNGVFLFKPSFTNIRYAVDKFPEIEWSEEAKKKLEECCAFDIQEATLQLVKESQEGHPVENYSCFDFKTKPFDHQLKAFNQSKDLKAYGVLFEQGCGKTKVIIDTARYLYDYDEIEAMVVVAPNGVHDNWVEEEGECAVHMAGEWGGVAWRSGAGKKKMEEWNELKEVPFLKVFAFNVEAFASKKAKDELLSILAQFKCLLAVDESQKIKNPSAKRTKFLCMAGKFAPYKRILTGTPVTKGLEDFYSQFRFLDDNILGITSFSAFKNRYCVMGGWEMKQIVSYNNVEELQKKVETYCTRVTKKECLDLPEKLYQFTYFDLTPAQLELIDQIKKEGIAELSGLKDDAIILDHVITRLTKIQQVSNGYFYDTENKKVIEIVPPSRNPRLLKAKDILAQTEGKTAIWTRYSADIVLIKKILNHGEYVTYDGLVSPDQRKENRRIFKNDPNCRNMLLNSQAGCTGITMTQAEFNLYYSNSYDLEVRLQSEDRTHRIGTVNNVLYNDLIANKTPDRKIISALRKKKSISDIVLQDPVGMFLEER